MTSEADSALYHDPHPHWAITMYHSLDRGAEWLLASTDIGLLDALWNQCPGLPKLETFGSLPNRPRGITVASEKS